MKANVRDPFRLKLESVQMNLVTWGPLELNGTHGGSGCAWDPHPRPRRPVSRAPRDARRGAEPLMRMRIPETYSHERRRIGSSRPDRTLTERV